MPIWFDVFACEGELYYWAAARIKDREGTAVIPLLGGRARIIRHHGWTAAQWHVLEGW